MIDDYRASRVIAFDIDPPGLGHEIHRGVPQFSLKPP